MQIGGTMYVLRLTESQRMALLTILLDHLGRGDTNPIFHDVLRGVETHVSELAKIVMDAPFDGNIDP